MIHGTTRIVTQSTTRAARDLAPGMVLRDSMGRLQAIQRVERVDNGSFVFFQPGALGVNAPNRLLIVSPDHLIRVPRNGRTMRADAALAVAGSLGGRMEQPMTGYHIVLPISAFVSAHGVMIQSKPSSRVSLRRPGRSGPFPPCDRMSLRRLARNNRL
ncbi:MAG: hypothetical protein EB027_06815 [Actinobacteria bacterium]|nr:hypothetical protein [Actinomycetota bacterium]